MYGKGSGFIPDGPPALPEKPAGTTSRLLEAKKRAEEALTNKESEESMATAQAELAIAMAQIEAIRKFKNRV